MESIRLTRVSFVVGLLSLALVGLACVSPTGGPPPEPPAAETVEVGFSHTCATTSERTVQCWGSNSKGQLGNGTMDDSAVPIPVPSITNAAEVDAGFDSSCALANGLVSCWGNNDNGQLGDGTTTDSSLPVMIPGLADVVSIRTGTVHGCALDTAGDVYCWGNNAVGQLGDSTLADSAVPVKVTGLSDVASISVDHMHSCALTIAGDARCWGDNSNGQLGIGSTVNSNVPVAPDGIPTASLLEAGASHTCAVVGTETSCWGGNGQGQLGNGTTSASLVPVPVVGLSSTPTRLAIGSWHTCAVIADGQGVCWGFNNKGQLGNGTTAATSTPAVIPGLTDVTWMSAGFTHTCAVVGETQTKCWGSNSVGQLGDATGGPGQYSTEPVVVAPAGSAALPPNTVITTTNFDLICKAYLGTTPVQDHITNQDLTVKAPSDVDPGETFLIQVTPSEVDVPVTDTGQTINSMNDLSWRIGLPANASLQSLNVFGGDLIGPGVPTATDEGTYVEFTTPGPLQPGTTVEMPTLELELAATGASGSTVDVLLNGTDTAADWDNRLLVNVQNIGWVTNNCFIDPSPVFSTTVIN